MIILGHYMLTKLYKVSSIQMFLRPVFNHRYLYFSTHSYVFSRVNLSDTKTPGINCMTMKNQIEKQYNDIIKSLNDKREYRGLLLENKMKVLLVSDPSTDKSAAALDVHVGYLSDPDELPGLAHFCEHMLFLGTQKYPEQNDYNKYLSQNGGSSNACTSMDHTTFHFDVDPEKLTNALDRFSQFFIAPLFTESLTDLELNSVHSEHEKNLASDAWRLNQLDKSSANPSHPYSKFATGNKETLKCIPKEKNINVREKLLEFHNKYYSANIMSLCVLGKENLDDLQKMVISMFGQIKNKNIEIPTWPEHPFTEDQFQTKWYIVPIKDLRSLNIIFYIPDLRKHYRSGPAHYISHLLGHEGKGSLLSALKAKGWCNSLLSGRRPGATGFNFFTIIVDLTEEGIKHVDDIITLIFQYINMLKKEGPVEWIHKEHTDIAKINFRFEEKCSPHKYVVNNVLLAQQYPMEEMLIAERLFEEWNPDLITWVLGFFKPQYIRVHVTGKLFENIANEKEAWYGTQFAKEKIPQDLLDKWTDPGFCAEFHLPLVNEFIPSNFDIKPAESNANKFPIIIEDTQFSRLWFKQDDEFLLPKANLTFDFVSPLAYLDPTSCNLTHMFVQLFKDAFNEWTYSAELAGLKWEITSSKHGIMLVIAGYRDKQKVLLEKCIDQMFNFVVDRKRFEVLKESHIRALKNFESEPPYQKAYYYLAVLLTEHVWTKDELLAAHKYVTFENVQEFVSQYFKRVHVECLIHGNITMSEAMETTKLIETKLTNKFHETIALLPRQLILYREIKLEDGCHYLYEIENKFHPSSCTLVYYQTALQSTESNMYLELLTQIVSEPCYNILRTKEQLGYIVFTGIRRTGGSQGLQFIVQSDKQPKYVEQRIDTFFNSMENHIVEMTNEVFNEYKESLAIQCLEKPKTLSGRTALFWNEISVQQYNFDRANIEVAFLRTITKEQILNFYKEIAKPENQRKLSVHSISTAPKNDTCSEPPSDEIHKENDTTISTDTSKKIDDIVSFKMSKSLFPLLPPYNNVPRKGAKSSKL